ncbi:MAG: alanine racemase [Gemmatimonadetes bacterium]|nr:alanine racemase [Gemmatimonadota bacterium]
MTDPNAICPPPADGRAWVEVDADALRANAASLAAKAGTGVALVPMVKADGYGLGAVEVARSLAPLKPWKLGVAAVAEGTALRRAGIAAPIFVASPALPSEIGVAVASGFELAITDLDQLRGIRELRAARSGGGAGKHGADRGPPVRVHLEIDTGMGRAGFDWRRASTWAPEVAGLLGRGRSADGAEPTLVLEGIFSHLHSADESEPSIREQRMRLESALARLAPRRPAAVHLLNSAGVLRAPDLAADAIRPGIFLYGGRPASDLELPRPVATVKARVAHVKEAGPGDTVGYGATYTARRHERWATLAIGYGDGLPRRLGDRGWAVLGGRPAPLIGRTSMDVTVVRVDAAQEVRRGDVATVIGPGGDEGLALHEVATLADTIPYEILTGLSPRLPRIWKGVPID